MAAAIGSSGFAGGIRQLLSTLTHPDSELQLCLDDELSRSLNNEQ
jgi:hypothetical protein